MVAHARLRSRLALAVVAALGAIASGSCDKLPLLAPQGTVISLFSTSMVLPLNGSVDITAIAIEAGAAPSTPTTPTPTPPTPGTPTTPTTPTPTPGTPGTGTPVHNGTVITFTTTLGRLEPAEARTHNGQASVRLTSTGQSGTATVVAFSGGARSASLAIRVGSAASSRVILSASPAQLPAVGGTSQISARVEDAEGSVVSGAPVTFSTTAGNITPSTANTDNNGIAVATLQANASADVVARSGAAEGKITVSLRPRSGLTLTGPATPPSEGLPATFTVAVAATANITNVRIDFGDGEARSLGAISGSTTIQHTYRVAGTYEVSATATQSTGDQETVATDITILPGQPPGVVVNVSDAVPAINQQVNLTAIVSGATSTIVRYDWNFGDGTTATTTGNQTSKVYTTIGTFTITVVVTQAAGPTGTGQASVNVTATGSIR
ncbi:MAG TPA: PKD domain-containing protein [Vicinamibacterales bacterium]|jgi:PKD repeat protein|nr:PKD domain-containing protein [Vicinamibacterales bacterium]